MYPELREERIHGTKEFPFSCYHLHDMPAFFQIPVHWHPEVEIIYVRSGSLNVIIEGEEYEAAGGSVFFVNPGELHFMGSAIPGVDYHTLLFPLEFISFQTDDLLETEFLLPLRNQKCFCIIIFPTKKAVLTSFLSSVRSCLSDSFQIH